MRRQGFFFQRRWFAAVYITVAIFILLLISFVFYWFHARTMEDLKASQTEVLNNTSTVFQSQLDNFSLAGLSALCHARLHGAAGQPRGPCLVYHRFFQTGAVHHGQQRLD